MKYAIAVAVVLAGIAVAYGQGVGMRLGLPSGTFTMVQSTDGNVWRINSATGEITKCIASMAKVTCYPPSR